MQTVQKIVEIPCVQWLGGRRTQFFATVGGVQTSSSTEFHDVFLPRFEASFGIRPFGRRVPACSDFSGSPRWPTVVGCRGLGVPGTLGVRLLGALPHVN